MNLMKRTVFILFAAVCVFTLLLLVLRLRLPNGNEPIPSAAAPDKAAANTIERAQAEATPVEHTPSGSSATETSSEAGFLEVEMFLGGLRKFKLREDEYERIVGAQERQLKQVIQRDIAAGINAEVRSNETVLRNVSASLRIGMPVGEVIKILGSPDRVQFVVDDTNGEKLDVATSLEQAPENVVQYASYWPRVGVAFDGRHGQGYRVLYLRLDTQQKLERWFWQIPAVTYVGSINSVRKQRLYWEGVHTVSPPPPKDSITDDFFQY